MRFFERGPKIVRVDREQCKEHMERATAWGDTFYSFLRVDTARKLSAMKLTHEQQGAVFHWAHTSDTPSYLIVTTPTISPPNPTMILASQKQPESGGLYTTAIC